MSESIRLQGEGKYMRTRYIDLLRPPSDYDVDEVVDEVARLGGLEVI